MKFVEVMYSSLSTHLEIFLKTSPLRVPLSETQFEK